MASLTDIVRSEDEAAYCADVHVGVREIRAFGKLIGRRRADHISIMVAKRLRCCFIVPMDAVIGSSTNVDIRAWGPRTD